MKVLIVDDSGVITVMKSKARELGVSAWVPKPVNHLYF